MGRGSRRLCDQHLRDPRRSGNLRLRGGPALRIGHSLRIHGISEQLSHVRSFEQPQRCLCPTDVPSHEPTYQDSDRYPERFSQLQPVFEPFHRLADRGSHHRLPDAGTDKIELHHLTDASTDLLGHHQLPDECTDLLPDRIGRTHRLLRRVSTDHRQRDLLRYRRR